MKNVIQNKADDKYFLSNKGAKYVSNPERLNKKFTFNKLNA